MRLPILFVAFLLAAIVLETHSVEDESASLLARWFLRKVTNAFSTNSSVDMNQIFDENFVIYGCNHRDFSREECMTWLASNPNVSSYIKIGRTQIADEQFPAGYLIAVVSILDYADIDSFQVLLNVSLPEHPYPKEVISVGPLIRGWRTDCSRLGTSHSS